MPRIAALITLLVGSAIGAPRPVQPEVATAAPVVIPFDFSAGKIFVQVSVNGSGPQWFALDTGSPTAVIDHTLCTEAGLECTPSGQASGAGVQASQMWIVSGAHVSLGGITLPEDDLVISIDIDRMLSPFSAHSIRGLVGNDFVMRHVVKVDYAARQLTISEPDGWDYRGDGQVVKVTVAGYDFIQGWITPPGAEPIRARFMIDTGAGLTASLNTHFVNRHHFLDGRIPTIEASVGFGVGGEVRESVARFDGVRIGDLSIDRPVVMLSQDQTGALAMTAMDGLIGGEILRKFTVIFDLPRHRMILEKNATFDDPTEFDMCGVTLRGSGAGALEVYRVTAGSPAADAGIAEGDIIEAVDGRAVAAPDRETVRELFKGDGQKRALTIRRAGRTLEVAITLRRMV